MIKRNRKIDDRIREMEEKVTDSKKRVYDRLDDLSELVDYEITDEINNVIKSPADPGFFYSSFSVSTNWATDALASPNTI